MSRWTIRTAALLGSVPVLASASIAAACTGAAPADSFSGPVLSVPEPGVICVALAPSPDQWVRVRLANGEKLPRNVLLAASFAKRLDCRLDHRGRGRCVVEGEDLVTRARSSSVRALADQWR